MSGGRALPWVLHCALSKGLPCRSPRPSRSPAVASASCVAGAALVLALAVLVPALLGYQRYVITSGSMTGTYDRGSLVFDKVVPTSSLRAGDVITFRPPGHSGLVTHRIHTLTSVDGKRVLTTKGDANRVPDAWGSLTLANALQARVAFHIPTSATDSPSSARRRSACSSSAFPPC